MKRSIKIETLQLVVGCLIVFIQLGAILLLISRREFFEWNELRNSLFSMSPILFFSVTLVIKEFFRPNVPKQISVKVEYVRRRAFFLSVLICIFFGFCLTLTILGFPSFFETHSQFHDGLMAVDTGVGVFLGAVVGRFFMK